MTVLYVGRELKFFSPLPTVPLTELSLLLFERNKLLLRSL
jgi:hypothetical protein